MPRGGKSGRGVGQPGVVTYRQGNVSTGAHFQAQQKSRYPSEEGTVPQTVQLSGRLGSYPSCFYAVHVREGSWRRPDITRPASSQRQPWGPSGQQQTLDSRGETSLDSRAQQIRAKSINIMPGRRHRHIPKRRRPSISRSARAELQFPVSRVDRLLREGHYAHRLSSATPVFLAGVLEYLTSNILERASEEAHNHHRMRITPEHVEKAVDNDQQLSLLFEDDTPLEAPLHLRKGVPE